MPPTNNGIPNGSATSREECRCPNCLSHEGLEPDPERAELYTDKATEIAQASRCANPACPTDAVEPKAIRKQLDTDALEESDPVIDTDSISLSELKSKFGDFAISQSVKVIGIVILFVISAMFGTYGGGFGGGNGNPGIAQAGGAYENATDVSGSEAEIVYTQGNWTVYKSGDTYIVSGMYEGSVVYLTENGYIAESPYRFDTLEAAKNAITIWETKHAENPEDFPGVDNVSTSVEDSNWQIFQYNGSYVIGGEIDGEIVFLHPNSGYSAEPYFYDQKNNAEEAVLYWASLSQVSDFPEVNPITEEELRAALTEWSEDASKFETWNSTEYGDWTIYTNGTHYTAAIYIDGEVRYIDFNGTTSSDPVFFETQTELLSAISQWQDATRSNTFDGEDIGDWRIYTDGDSYVAAAYLDGELVYLQADGTYGSSPYEFSDKTSLLDAIGAWLDSDHADIEPIDSTVPDAGDWSVYTNGSVYTAAGYLNGSIQYLDSNNAASADPVFFDNGVDFREAIDAWNPDDHPELYPIRTHPWTIYTDGSSFAAAALKDGETVYVQPDGSTDASPYTYDEIAPLLEAIDQWREGDTSGFEPINSSSVPSELGAGWWDPNWGYGEIPSTFDGDWESTTLDSTFIPSDLDDSWYAPDQGTSYPDTRSIDSIDNTSLSSDWEQIDSQTGSTGGEITYPDDGMVSNPSNNTDDDTSGTTISGSVSDSNGDPVEGATVTLHSNPRTTTTDASGTYSFYDVPAGEHTLHVAPPDGTDLAGPRNISIDVTQEGDVEAQNDPENVLFFEGEDGYVSQNQFTFVTPKEQQIELSGSGVNISNNITVHNPSNIEQVDVSLTPKLESTDKTYSIDGSDSTSTVTISGDTIPPDQQLILSSDIATKNFTTSGKAGTSNANVNIKGNRPVEDNQLTVDPVTYTEKQSWTGTSPAGSDTITVNPDTVLEPSGGNISLTGKSNTNQIDISKTHSSGEMTSLDIGGSEPVDLTVGLTGKNSQVEKTDEGMYEERWYPAGWGGESLTEQFMVVEGDGNISIEADLYAAGQTYDIYGPKVRAKIGYYDLSEGKHVWKEGVGECCYSSSWDVSQKHVDQEWNLETGDVIMGYIYFYKTRGADHKAGVQNIKVNEEISTGSVNTTFGGTAFNQSKYESDSGDSTLETSDEGLYEERWYESGWGDETVQKSIYTVKSDGKATISADLLASTKTYDYTNGQVRASIGYFDASEGKEVWKESVYESPASSNEEWYTTQKDINQTWNLSSGDAILTKVYFYKVRGADYKGGVRDITITEDVSGGSPSSFIAPSLSEGEKWSTVITAEPGSTLTVNTTADGPKVDLSITGEEETVTQNPQVSINGESVMSHDGDLKWTKTAEIPDGALQKGDNTIEVSSSGASVDYNVSVDTVHVPTDPQLTVGSDTMFKYNGPLTQPQSIQIPKSKLPPGQNELDFQTTEGEVNWTLQYEASAVPTDASVSIGSDTYNWPTDFEGNGQLPTEPSEDTSINISSLDVGDQTVSVATTPVDSIETTGKIGLKYQGETQQTTKPAIKVVNAKGEIHTKSLSDDALEDGKLTSNANVTLPGDWFTEGENQVIVVTEGGSKIGATVTTDGLTYQNKTMTSAVG